MRSLRFAVRVHSIDYGTKEYDKLFCVPTSRIERSYQVFEAFNLCTNEDIVVIICFYDYWTGKQLPLYRPLENKLQNIFEPLDIIIDFID